MHSDFEEDNNSIQSMFIKMSHLYFTKTFQQLASSGVHPGQLPMIKVLGKNGGLSQKEISHKLKIKPPTVNVSLRRMESAGFIEKKADSQDQRVTRVYLSEKGYRIYEKMDEMLKNNEKALLHGFTESEMCLLKRFFQQMLGNMEHISEKDIFEKEKGI